MNLTKYNPNNDRGISTQANGSGLRCFDGEDLCKYYPLLLLLPSKLNFLRSEGRQREAAEGAAEGVGVPAAGGKAGKEGSGEVRTAVSDWC